MIKTSSIFLFSHFDSRGGSYAVKAKNKKQAMEAIIHEFFKFDKKDPDYEVYKQIISDDFVAGPIDLYTDDKPINKEDLAETQLTEFEVSRGSRMVGIGVSKTKLKDIQIEKFKIDEMELSEDAFGLIYLEA